jgi:hypothetical protein
MQNDDGLLDGCIETILALRDEAIKRGGETSLADPETRKNVTLLFQQWDTVRGQILDELDLDGRIARYDEQLKALIDEDPEYVMELLHELCDEDEA